MRSYGCVGNELVAPNQVANASGSCGSVRLPVQATCPSGRINTARGAVVCEPDLYDALKGRRIAGAGLDVFEPEPPAGSPLLQLDNVVLTAHTAGVDARSGDDMALLAAQTIVQVCRGEWPEALIINPACRARLRK